MFVLSKMQTWMKAWPFESSGAFAAFQKNGSGFTTNVAFCCRPLQSRLRPGPSEFQFVL